MGGSSWYVSLLGFPVSNFTYHFISPSSFCYTGRLIWSGNYMITFTSFFSGCWIAFYPGLVGLSNFPPKGIFILCNLLLSILLCCPGMSVINTMAWNTTSKLHIIQCSGLETSLLSTTVNTQKILKLFEMTSFFLLL